MVLRLRPRLAIVGLLGGMIAALGWLLFGIAGDRSGMRPLPDAAGDATILVLREAQRRFTIGEVQAEDPAAWQAWDGSGYIVAPEGVATWIKVTLANRSEEALRGVLADSEYFTDRVDFWEANEGSPETWRHEVAGEGLRGGEKSLGGRFPAFVVAMPAASEKTFYLRGEDRFVPASRIVWWPRIGNYLAAQFRSVLAESVCYGGLAALLLYHALLWVRLRYADIAWYVLGAGALVTFNFVMNGGPALLGWATGSPAKETIATFALGLHSVFLVQFARAFLELRTRSARSDLVAKALAAVGVVIALGSLAMPWMRTTWWIQTAVPLSGLLQIVLLGVAVVTWRQGARHARFFILASGAMLVSELPAIVNWVARDVGYSGAMGVLGGSTLEILLLSLAVADRFSQAQREKAEAQRRLIEEAAVREAVQEAYADELEVEVRERTRELEAANADKDRMITVLGHDLRGPLTGLTRSAEYAANAQSTRLLTQFAEDAAATSRYLLLMIEDLVLWARLRAGAGHVAPCSVHMLVAPAVALHRTSANRDGVSLAVDVPDTLRVQTDLVLMQTLVRNLVDNAVKHARAGVKIAAREDGGGVRLSICDDGPGLPEDVAAWLSDNGKAPGPAGSGLGLRLCREIARTLGLRIETRRATDGGAAFVVVLQRAGGGV